MQKKFSIYEEAQRWAQHNGLLFQAFDETESTNKLAKEQAWWVPEPLIILAKTQTQGRGRGKNTWTDCGDSSLTMTWSITLEKAPSHLTAPRVGLALFQAATSVWDESNFSLKAPNDLFLNQMKVAGLLVEMVQQGLQRRWIIGLGMNFYESPTELPQSTAINDHTLLLADDFRLFLQLFNEKIMNLIPLLDDNHLNPAEQEMLYHALLANDAYAGLEEISDEGDLVFKKKRISWSDL